MDEDELERELEELEQEELDKELLGVGPSANELPEVPTEDLKDQVKEKQKKKGRTLLVHPTACSNLTSFRLIQPHQRKPTMTRT